MNSEELKFSIFCIGGVAEELGISARKVYHLLKQSGILDEYIVPCYDVLHTFGEKYLVNDIVEYMKKKGVISEVIADMHCRSDEYLVDELVLEYGKKK